MTIRGWVFAAAQARAPYVLFFYGSNEDAQIERKRMDWLSHSIGVNAVVFDYRGYGFSGGQVAPGAMRDDATAALGAVRSMAGDAPVVSYGWSVGAEFAIHAAATGQVAGLILQAPPASADEMAAWSRRHDVPAPLRWAVGLRHDAEVAPVFSGASEIALVRSPILVTQGAEDDVVPLSQGREVFAASPSLNKTMVVVPGAHHNDLRFTAPPAGPAISAFLSSSVVLQQH